MITRRCLGLAALAVPGVARGAGRSTLRYVPNTDLTLLDPVWTAAFVTRVHGLMVFDTLYGQDDTFAVRPQMVEGERTEDGGKTWRLTLREGLRFHDGTPVLGRDVVASLRRWGRVDAFGQTLLGRADELSAPSDREVVFRLKAPFPLLPDALGKSTAFLPAIMPARIAEAAGSRAVNGDGGGVGRSTIWRMSGWMGCGASGRGSRGMCLGRGRRSSRRAGSGPSWTGWSGRPSRTRARRRGRCGRARVIGWSGR